MPQATLQVDAIKQHSGAVTVQRRVKVNVPGKHFPGLQAAEQKTCYEGKPVEFSERHKFSAHAKAWGVAHTGPGIRFLCVSDAIDDPDHRGFWTTLFLFNRWRHETYKNNPSAELQYLDELPAAPPEPTTAGPKVKEEPPIKKLFNLVRTSIHTCTAAGEVVLYEGVFVSVLCVLLLV